MLFPSKKRIFDVRMANNEALRAMSKGLRANSAMPVADKRFLKLNACPKQFGNKENKGLTHLHSWLWELTSFVVLIFV